MSEYVPLSEYVPMSENVPLSKFFDAYKCCKGRRRRLLNASRLKKFAHFSYLTLTKCRTNELLWYLRRGWHIYLLSNENLILSFIDTNLWIPLHLFLASIYDLWREGYTYSDPNIDSTFLFKNCPRFLPIYLSFHFYEKPKFHFG